METRTIVAVAVIGLALYLLMSKTAPKIVTVSRPPASAGAGTTLKNDVSAVGSLLTGLGGLFKTSSSGPAIPGSTTPAIPGPTSTQIAQQESAWNNESSSDFDSLAEGDAAMGVEGPF